MYPGQRDGVPDQLEWLDRLLRFGDDGQQAEEPDRLFQFGDLAGQRPKGKARSAYLERRGS